MASIQLENYIKRAGLVEAKTPTDSDHMKKYLGQHDWQEVDHKNVHHHVAKGSPMHDAVETAKKHGGSIHSYEGGSDEHDAHGIIVHHPHKGHYHIKLGGDDVSDHNHTVHSTLHDAMEHLRKNNMAG